MLDFNITDFGAVANGTTLCTSALQRTIDAAAERGGRVVIPPGQFLIGTIELRSRVTLDICQGALLLGSPNLGDYRKPLGWGWMHNESPCDVTPWHLIQAVDVQDVVITGEGSIVGNGPFFWDADRPSEWHFWKHRENRRPSPMVHFENARRVRIENVTMRDSAGWTLHLHNCENVRVSGVRIRNTFFGPNTDGIDISNCRSVLVSDCDIATGDDAIAVMSSQYGGPSSDIAIMNCVLRTSCVGLRIIGFDHGARHSGIVASNLVIPRCSRLFDIRSQNGTRIENVSISNCVGSTNSGWPINRPFEIVALDHDNPHSSDINPDGKKSLVRGVSISNVDIVTDGRSFVSGAPGHVLQDISLTNLRFRYVLIEDPGQTAGRSPLGGDSEASRAMAAIIARRVENLAVRDLSIQWPRYPVTDDWFTFDSTQRSINAGFWEGSAAEIRSGAKRGRLKAIWGRDLVGGFLDLSGLTDSEKAPPSDLAGCQDCLVR